MRDVTKPASGGLTESFANKLLSGIAESRATTVIGGGGKPFLRLLKSGEWVFGQENEDVQAGSQWVINTMSLAHGYCCWVDAGPGKANELRGEVMISMTEPKPLRPAPIDGTPYAEQRSFEAKCISGADAGREVLYKTASLGGMRAVDDVLIEVQNQLLTEDGVAFPCPVVRLEADDYTHKKYGQIYTPIFEVMAWSSMEGKLQPAGRPVVAPELEAAPAPAARGKARKPALEAATGPASEGVERTVNRGRTTKPALDLEGDRIPREAPQSTTQAHVGQRRRPTSR